MYRRKKNIVRFLIFFALFILSGFQFGTKAGSGFISETLFSDSAQRIYSVSGFELNHASLKYVKNYIDENRWGLEKVKKGNKSKLKTINSVFARYGIPVELKYMAIVESGLNTDTVCNSSGATGAWQLMPGTANELGLKITDEVDERLHLEKSSVAAARYLKKLYAEFGDWLFVIAAYNSGPAKVSRAIKLSGHQDFWQIQQYLPAETRNHVKRFVSVLYYFEEQNNSNLQYMT